MKAEKGKPTPQHDRPKRGWLGIISKALFGVFCVFAFTSLLIALVKNWDRTSWDLRLIVLPVATVAIVGGAALALSPWRHRSTIGRIIDMLLATNDWIASKLAAAQILYWAFVAFILLFVIPAMSWRVVELIGLAPVIPEKASTYSLMLFAAVTFTYWGRSITYQTTRKVRREQHAGVFGLLSPNNIRFLIFGLMATTYIAANWEKFSGITLTTAEWWIRYKDVLLEVFLSYTAIDSALAAWRDRRSTQTPQG